MLLQFPPRQNEHSASSALEIRAQAICARTRHETWDNAPESSLGREIYLTLEQLKRVREAHKQAEEDLLKLECRVDTEAMNIQHPAAEFHPDRLPDSKTLVGIKMNIESEKRRMGLMQERRLQELEDRLLTLLNRHAVLSM